MNGDDLDDAAPQVIITSYENAAAQVRLHDRRLLGEYETTFAVGLHADGLNARVGEVSVTTWDGGGLPGFLEGLAADFRGWAGTRSWAAGHFTLTAAFHSGGHVELCWAIQPGISRSGWKACLTTWIEGGEQMSEVAAAVRTFLSPAQPAQLRHCDRGACVRRQSP